MRKPNPALVAVHDFVRDLIALGTVGLVIAAIAVWAIYLREPPPVTV